jgi:hypothetical protein
MSHIISFVDLLGVVVSVFIVLVGSMTGLIDLFATFEITGVLINKEEEEEDDEEGRLSLFTR